MENDLISRSALLEATAAAFFKTEPTGEEQLGYLACNRIVREFPGIDAEPVRHGRWFIKVNAIGRTFTCSKCRKWIIPTTNALMNYCPNCGAKMDAQEEA